jgi:hypothetical protein
VVDKAMAGTDWISGGTHVALGVWHAVLAGGAANKPMMDGRAHGWRVASPSHVPCRGPSSSSIGRRIIGGRFEIWNARADKNVLYGTGNLPAALAGSSLTCGHGRGKPYSVSLLPHNIPTDLWCAFAYVHGWCMITRAEYARVS